jgi:hypothetical protein
MGFRGGRNLSRLDRSLNRLGGFVLGGMERNDAMNVGAPPPLPSSCNGLFVKDRGPMGPEGPGQARGSVPKAGLLESQGCGVPGICCFRTLPAIVRRCAVQSD